MVGRSALVYQVFLFFLACESFPLTQSGRLRVALVVAKCFS